MRHPPRKPRKPTDRKLTDIIVTIRWLGNERMPMLMIANLKNAVVKVQLTTDGPLSGLSGTYKLANFQTLIIEEE